MSKKKVGVLLSGCGVYDGSEIHEAVFTLWAIEKAGGEWFCIAPNKPQLHVINHLNGSEMAETRNVLIESARIARGNIKDIAEVSIDSMDALVLPGGFGTAKNLTQWAVQGPDTSIDESVKNLILSMLRAKKPVGALCMSPTTLAKATQGSEFQISVTIGNTSEKSPYDIAGINTGLEKVGAKPIAKSGGEIYIDEKNKIVTSPCYMMEVGMQEVANGAEKVVNALFKMM